MSASTPASLRLVGGTLCLDFHNTARGWLEDYETFLRWGRGTGHLDRGEARQLERMARSDPAAAAAALDAAVALREALIALFAESGKGEAKAIRTINALLAAAPSREALAKRGGRLAWRLSPEGRTLQGPLWPILWDAADLLISPRAARVRRCAAEDCYWLFLDLSRNRSRRWCSMEDCGNRAKARRHYVRHKGGRR